MAIKLGDRMFKVVLENGPRTHTYTAKIGARIVKFEVEELTERSIVIKMEGERLEFKRSHPTVEFQTKSTPRLDEEKDSLISPMPGKVVSIVVKEGQHVKQGEALVILESMKMESVLRSDRNAKVLGVLVTEGSSVRRGQTLIKYET